MKKRTLGVGVLLFGYSLALSSVAVDRVSAAGAAQTTAAERAQASDAE